MTDWLGNALARCVGQLLRWRLVTAVVVLAASGVCADYAAQHLGVNTNTADMISDKLSWRQDFIAYRNAFPVRNRNIVAVVDADTDAEAVNFASRLAASLRQEPELFRSVFLAGDGEFFDRHGLLYLSTDELESLSDRLVEAQPLFGLLGERGNGADIVSVLARSSTESGSQNGAQRQTLDDLYLQLASTLDAAAAGTVRPVNWRGLFAQDADRPEQRMILIQPALDFRRVRPARPAIERLRAIAAALAEESVGHPGVRLTGTITMEDEELDSVVRGASVAGIAALVMVAVVLLVTLRSLMLLAIALVTLLAGLVGTAAFAAAIVPNGQLNLLSVAFAVLYVGLGVDFILHIVLRFKELERAGTSRHAAIVESMRGVGSSLVLCAITTAAGFYAFVPTQFQGVSQLGLISGTGMFVSLFASIVLLPALLGLFAPSVTRPASRARWLVPVSDFLAARPRGVVAVSAVIVIASALLLPRVRFDSNPVKLRDPAAESVVVLDDLASRSNASFMSLVALTDNPATAARWADELDRLPQVDSVTTLDSLVPADQEDKLAILDDLGLVLGPGFGHFEQRAPDGAALLRALENLGAALRAETSPSDAQMRLMTAIDRVLALKPAADSAMLRSLDSSLVGDLPRELALLAEGLGAGPVTEDSLPADLLERWRTEAGVELVDIKPSGNINDSDDAGAFVDAVRSVVPTATGLPVVYREASKTVVESFRLALTYAFVIVTAILIIFLRRIGDCLLVLVPIICAAIVTAGATVLLGISFNFANIIALPLLVGVGVDSGIHIVHRMRTDPSTRGDVLHTSTSRAVLASILTTIASFGNLAFSSHVGMSSMGQLLTLGMLLTLVATLALLPALLRLRRGTAWTS